MVLASAGSACAPTTRSTGLPSRRKTRVGIELASKLREIPGLSSTLTLNDLEFADVSLRESLEHRGDHPARSTPRGPQIHEDELFGRRYLGEV